MRAKSRRLRRRTTCFSMEGNVVRAVDRRLRSPPAFRAKPRAWHILRRRTASCRSRRACSRRFAWRAKAFRCTSACAAASIAKRDTFNAGAAARIFLRKGEVPDGRHDHQTTGAGADADDARRARRRRLLQRPGREAAGRRRAQAGRHLVAAGSRRATRSKNASRCTANIAARASSPRRRRPPAAWPCIDALNILSGYDLQSVDSATRKHLIVEACARVHRDRAEYLGDPDFVTVPVEQLVESVLRRRPARLDSPGSRHAERRRCRASTGAEPGTQTTHFSDHRCGRQSRRRHA